ncbi:hypothetical protein PR048_023146 [Dryococelus australis]|uniref:Uncharacterized protein n=1 Tax=Dryococelus australis TaxID=614101 RepID=A0ABQ9GT84_9NEOP|nr:hypothetical protein PR048_023146 [Dryococelus australis]
MPLVSGFSRGSPIYPTLSFRRCSILTSITLIGSQDLDVTSRPNLYIHSCCTEKLHLTGTVLCESQGGIHTCSRYKGCFQSLAQPGSECTRPYHTHITPILWFAIANFFPQLNKPLHIECRSIEHLECEAIFLTRESRSKSTRRSGTTMAEQLDCSPPTKANQVQSPAGFIRISASGNRAARCRWSTGFLRDLPFPPASLFRRCFTLTSLSPLSALKTSLLRAAKSLHSLGPVSSVFVLVLWPRNLLLLPNP